MFRKIEKPRDWEGLEDWAERPAWSEPGMLELFVEKYSETPLTAANSGEKPLDWIFALET